MKAIANRIAAETPGESRDESMRKIRFASDRAVTKWHHWAIRKFAAMFRVLAK